MMEDYTLDYRAPLYGRRPAQLQLQPLKFILIWDDWKESRREREFEGGEEYLCYDLEDIV